MNVWLLCGVSYGSDLYEVEKISIEVMDEVLESEPQANKEYGSWFGFDSFGDSNVNFWLFVQAQDRWGSFVVKTALIKRLHQRFREEGIVINYPMRTLQFPPGWGPETLAQANGAHSAQRAKDRTQGRRARRRRLPRQLHAMEAGEGDSGGG